MAEQVVVKRCNRPGCTVQIKPGQLACRDHWRELPAKLRDRLVFAWEQRKAHPDIPELVSIHRALLLEALKAWGIPPEEIERQIKRAPRALQNTCPFCGAVAPIHRLGCPRLD
jgi:hypothetical protein